MYLIFLITFIMDIKNIFNIKNNNDFDKTCIEVFNFQYNNNIIYKTYVDLINVNPKEVNDVRKIPFLPIQRTSSNYRSRCFSKSKKR